MYGHLARRDRPLVDAGHAGARGVHLMQHGLRSTRPQRGTARARLARCRSRRTRHAVDGMSCAAGCAGQRIVMWSEGVAAHSGRCRRTMRSIGIAPHRGSRSGNTAARRRRSVTAAVRSGRGAGSVGVALCSGWGSGSVGVAVRSGRGARGVGVDVCSCWSCRGVARPGRGMRDICGYPICVPHRFTTDSGTAGWMGCRGRAWSVDVRGVGCSAPGVGVCA